MKLAPATRIYAGPRIRELREREKLRQSSMAARLGISTSYLSQIEANDRPITASVTAAFAREFPDAWADLVSGDEASVLAQISALSNDRAIFPRPLDHHVLKGVVKRYPQLAEGLIALHQAYQRSQEQLRTLDDRLTFDLHDPAQLPWEEVRDWFHAERNYIDPLDRAAEMLSDELSSELPPRQRLEAALLQRYDVRIATLGAGQNLLRAYDPVARVLYIDPAQSPESTLFTLARQIVKFAFVGIIDSIASNAGRSSAASELLTAGLENYAAGALLMPYRQCRSAASKFRHDIDQIRLVFGTSFEQTCHRLSTLQRQGERGTPMFFSRVDMAGNITKRHSATRLQFAQFGGTCPLWIVHEAVAIPDRILVQLAETPDGVRYVSMAKGLVKPSSSFARSPRRYAVALGCEVEHAADFIYADGLQLTGSATPIGSSCRICPRQSCEQRAYPPAGANILIDPNSRGLVPYSFN